MEQESTGSAPNQRVARLSSTDGIAERVVELRRRRGFGVSELARLVGVSPSLISQIERGQSRPSVATLFSLARALSVPVDAFFPEEESGRRAGDAEASEVRELAPGWAIPTELPHRYLVRRGERSTLEIKGGVRWERLTPTSLDWIDFLELVYAPDAESDRELYRHPGIEMVMLLEGRLDIFVGFEKYELGAGDSMAFPSSIPHRYVNPTNEVSRAITVILRDNLSTLGPGPQSP